LLCKDHIDIVLKNIPYYCCFFRLSKHILFKYLKLGIKIVALDEVSKTILRLLQNDSDITLAELAAKVGLSHSPVWQRLRQLRKSGVIKGNVALVDPELVGQSVGVLCFIKLNSHIEAQIESFARGVNNIPEVIQCFSIAGENDFLLRAVASSISHYDNVVKPKILKLPSLGSLNTNFILSEIKNTNQIPIV
jgi:Lrp/AsnC family transcriptional regulator